MITEIGGKKYQCHDLEPDNKNQKIYKVGESFRLNEYFVSEKLPFGWRIIRG